MRTPRTTPGLVLLVFLAVAALPSYAQLYEPEGLNMPGSWDVDSLGRWRDPPSLDPFAGRFRTPDGELLIDSTLLPSRRYRTTIQVEATGGDLPGGTYSWLFTSPQFGNPGGNKWYRTAPVVFDTILPYIYTSGSPADSNTVTLVNGNYYTVSYDDIGYTNGRAAWMRTSGIPMAIDSVRQWPLADSVESTGAVDVTAVLAGTPSSEEKFTLRYSTNNFVSSTFLPMTLVGTTASAQIPALPGGTTVKYYVLSSTFNNVSTDTHVKTLMVNNNNRQNYTYTVGADTLAIVATAGPNGSIVPSGTILVPRNQDTSLTITPDPTYYVDSLIVDGLAVTPATSYTFTNVTANHTIHATFALKVNVTFGVNMKKKMSDGVFRPDSGDVVTVRGSFNDWGNSTNNPDTLADGNADSIWTITKLLKVSSAYEYKFWKTERGGQGYETNISNRPLTLGTADTSLPVPFFDNDVPPAAPVNVTFQVDMSLKMLERSFRPDSGDVVTVRGSFNDWGNSTNNPDTLTDGDNDSIYTRTRSIAGEQTIQYKFWKSIRDGYSYEDGIPNREFTLGSSNVSIPAVWFDNDSLLSVTVPLIAGWNMISLPVAAPNDSMVRVYPSSLLPYAFAFSPASGYQQRQQLEIGPGYWGKFSSGHLNDIPGAYVYAESVDVSAGWNMIGTISLPLDTADVTTDPAGLRSSNFFGYSAGYAPAAQLVPGKAYWVKAAGAGRFILATSGLTAVRPVPRSQGMLEQSGSLTLTDATGARQTLYLTTQSLTRTEMDFYQMPPAPPEGAFDARFASGRMLESIAGDAPVRLPIGLEGAVHPVVVSWSKIAGGARSLTLNAGGKPVALSGSGSMTIPAGGGMIAIEAGASEIPGEFALAQNYPNPFNPSTTIRYALPVDGRITIRVYDIVGRLVATLVDEIQPAGYRSVSWEGRNAAGLQAASGVYFYRLEAIPVGGGSRFMSINKMILVR